MSDNLLLKSTIAKQTKLSAPRFYPRLDISNLARPTSDHSSEIRKILHSFRTGVIRMDVKLALCYRQLPALIGLLAISLLLATGCGKKDGDKKGESSGNENSSADAQHDQTAAVDSAKMLVGTWYGRAQLDQNKLQQKLQSVTDLNLRQQLKMISDNFQTTEIGAQFTADGTMLLDVIVKSGNQEFRDSTSGQWTVIKTEPNAVFVETVEQLPSGGTEKSQMRYQFEQNGNLAIMVAPTSEQLADCNPVFVFQRVQPVEASVADAPGGLIK